MRVLIITDYNIFTTISTNIIGIRQQFTIFFFFPVGEKLIKDLLDDFLFPASKLIFDTRSTPSKETVIDVHPK